MEPLPLVSNQYFQGKPPAQIKYLAVLLEDQVCKAGLLTKMYEATIGHGGIQMPVQYRTTFIKYIISQVTKWAVKLTGDYDDGNDEDDDPTPELDLWYEELEKLSSHLPEPFFRLFNFHPEANDSQIKIYENENAFVSEGTTGLMTWTASTEFAKWLICSGGEQRLGEVSWVMEIGAGTGFLGIAAIKSFPNIAKFIATDGSERALENCRQNFTTNLSPAELSKAHFDRIDWISDVEKFQDIVSKDSEKGKGVLLGADIIFDVSLVQPLIDLINIFLDSHHPEGSSCLLSSTIRNEETFGIFQSKLESLPNRTFRNLHSWNNEEKGTGFILEIR